MIPLVETTHVMRPTHEAICRLDFDFIATIYRSIKPATTDRVIWIAMHKARVTLAIATEDQRQESREWLRAGGFSEFIRNLS